MDWDRSLAGLDDSDSKGDGCREPLWSKRDEHSCYTRDICDSVSICAIRGGTCLVSRCNVFSGHLRVGVSSRDEDDVGGEKRIRC